jgi:putative Holliday junction resolvase
VRALGVDLGERRIGLAVSDSQGVLASPYATLERTGDADRDRDALVATVEEVGAGVVVVGLPLELSGRRGPAATAAVREASALEAALAEREIAVETFDERLTTVSAERALADAGRTGRARRRVIDQQAAAVMLQAWLDGRQAANGA